MAILTLLKKLLYYFLSRFKGLFLLFLIGNNVFLRIFYKPWYPESTTNSIFEFISVFDFKNNL